MTDTGIPEAEGGRPLRDVYSVALGVALVLAVEQVVDVEGAGIPIRGDASMTFLAFIATGFSLYHWATRFIDLFFAGRDRSQAATAVSLVVGVTELLLLIALSVVISRPSLFLAGLTILLAFEVLAGFALRGVGAYGAVDDFGRSYLVVNAVALMVAAAAVLIDRSHDRELVTALSALVVAWARALVFYRIGFELLFPRPSGAEVRRRG